MRSSAPGGLVTAGFDQTIDERCVGRDHGGSQPVGATCERQAVREPVPGQRHRGLARERGEAFGIARERGVIGAVRPRVEDRITRLARALVISVAERGLGLRVGRRGSRGVAQALDEGGSVARAARSPDPSSTAGVGGGADEPLTSVSTARSPAKATSGAAIQPSRLISSGVPVSFAALRQDRAGERRRGAPRSIDLAQPPAGTGGWVGSTYWPGFESNPDCGPATYGNWFKNPSEF